MNSRNEYDSCRLVIERGAGADILLIADDQGFSLPVVRVPRWERAAPHIIDALREIWDVGAYCLFAPNAGPGDLQSEKYQVVEVCRPNVPLPDRWHWSPIESLAENILPNLDDLRIIHSVKAELTAHAGSSMPGFFGKPQWIEAIFEWVQQEIIPLGLCLTGQFRQLNASRTFSLIRVETNGPALWFKAVGEPHLHEYSITLALTKLFPAHLPRMIATRRDCNAWLTTEAAGTHPDANSNPAMWTTVARTLADLQIASLGQSLHLVDAGCRHLRLSALVDVVQPFLEVMSVLMEQQITVSPASLSRRELLTLGDQLKDALSTLDRSEMPNTLGHLDFNPGNILVHQDQCVFLDWAEAFVGHPFLTFQYLVEHLRRLRPTDDIAEKKLVAAYINKWSFFFDPQKTAEAFAVTPLLAAFAHAIALDAWRDPVRLSGPDSARHLRSMTRRMKREAEALVARRLPCTS